MKKLYYLLVSMLLFLGSNMVKADNVSPYVVDFNTTISTTDHAFKVASGWNHLVEKAYLDYSDTYVSYKYSATDGVESSGALNIGSQTLSSGGDYWGDSEEKEVHDYLVTPQVSGAVSIKAKRSSYSHYIQFYKATKNEDGSFTIGDTIMANDGTNESPSYNMLYSDSYTTLDLGTFDEPTYIAIRGNEVYIDDFSAESADVEYVRALTITNESAVKSSPDANADGKFPVTIAVSLTNTGDYDLAPGDADYTITVIQRDNNEEIGTAAINIPLAKGKSGKDTITVMADYAKYPDQSAYKVRENISGTIYAYQAWVDPIAYEPVLDVRLADNTILSDSDAISFGMIAEETTKEIVVSNKGAKEMNVQSIDLPDGFTVDKATFTVAPHMSDTLRLSAYVDVKGIKNGDMVFNIEGLSSFTLRLSATILDATKYFIDFEDNKMPAGTIQEGNSWSIYRWNEKGNMYVLQNSNVQETRFITPLLKVGEGEKLSFDASRQSASSYVTVNYSTDRKNWIRVDSIGSDQLSDKKISGSSWGASKYELTTFVVDNIPAGNYYIAFGSGYANIDNIYGFEVVPVDHDIMVSKSDIPTSGVVNNPYKASVTLKNSGINDEDAGSYTATLYLGDEEITAESVLLKASDSKAYQFDTTPHKTGTFETYAKFVFNGGYTVTTDTVTVTIADEVPSNEIQVGENGKAQSTTPLNLSYYNSETETVYDTDMLKDLKKGDKITSITFKGYKTTEPTTSTVNIWIANTTEGPAENVAAYTRANTDTMTNVLSGSYTFNTVGSSDRMEPLLTATFAEPFVYGGANLRIIVSSENADAWKAAFFEATDETGHTFGRQNDSHDAFLTATFNTRNTPVVHFGVEVTPTTFSGTVKSTDGKAIGDAVVTLKSGDVLYSDTTDAQGNFSIEVIQSKLNYDVLVDAAGYMPYSKPVTFDGSLETDIVLQPATGLYIVESNIPGKGSVNNRLTATANVKNIITSGIAAQDYKAQFFVDGTAVSEPQTVDLASQADTDYSFEYTPHTDGTFPAYILFSYNGNTYSTDTINIEIAPEVFSGEYTAGDSTGIAQEVMVAPWNNWYKRSQSVVVYTPEQLGIERGSVITNIRFRGRFTATGVGKEAASLFIGNTDANLENANSSNEVAAIYADTVNMTRLLDLTKDSLDYAITENEETIDIINVDIPGGFVYDGRNIAVVFNGNHVGQPDNRSYIVVDNTQTRSAWARGSDRDNIETSDFERLSALPVMYMTVDNKKTIGGNVITLSSEPISGANVTVKSDDVEYTAITDENGHYTIDLAKGLLTYNVIFEADGFKTDTVSSVTFAGSSDITVNDTLAHVISISGVVNGTDVTDNGVEQQLQTEPVADATVTVTDSDGNIVATTTTGTDGTYTVDGLTEGEEYVISVTASGFVDKADTIVADATDMTVEPIIIWTDAALGIESASVVNSSNHNEVYTINGQFLGRDIDRKTLRPGIYIINGKKVVIK